MDSTKIVEALHTLSESGILMQDILASAIRRKSHEVIVEMAKHCPTAISTNLGWADYLSGDTYSCVDLLIDSREPSLYWDFINNATEIPPEFGGVCYDTEDDDIENFGAASYIAMRVGVQANTALAIKDPEISDRICKAAIGYLNDRCDDIGSYAVDVLDAIDRYAGKNCDMTELGWFFLDAVKVLIGREVECAWTIAHPKAKDDTI